MNAPTRIDDPALSWARLLALTEGPAGLEIRAALREHVGNILSRLSNEAQAQVLVAEAWGSTADATDDEKKAAALARVAALSWVQGALASAHGMALASVPFEVPACWNEMPNECVRCEETAAVDEHRLCSKCRMVLASHRWRSEADAIRNGDLLPEVSHGE